MYPTPTRLQKKLMKTILHLLPFKSIALFDDVILHLQMRQRWKKGFLYIIPLMYAHDKFVQIPLPSMDQHSLSFIKCMRQFRVFDFKLNISQMKQV